MRAVIAALLLVLMTPGATELLTEFVHVATASVAGTEHAAHDDDCCADHCCANGLHRCGCHARSLATPSQVARLRAPDRAVPLVRDAVHGRPMTSAGPEDAFVSELVRPPRA